MTRLQWCLFVVGLYWRYGSKLMREARKYYHRAHVWGDLQDLDDGQRRAKFRVLMCLPWRRVKLAMPVGQALDNLYDEVDRLERGRDGCGHLHEWP